jgi:hypothetical protein
VCRIDLETKTMPNRFAVRRASTVRRASIVAAIAMFLCGAATLANAASPNPMAADFTFTHSDAAPKDGENQQGSLKSEQKTMQKSAAQNSNGGAAIGKPKPNALSFSHYYDVH